MADIKLKNRYGEEQLFPGDIPLGIPTETGEIQHYVAGEYDEKTVYLDFSNGDMAVKPDSGKVLTKVDIPMPLTLLPENIAEGVKIAGVKGTFSGSGETGKVKSKAINFYDPMGEILYSYTRAEAAGLTELPPGPELEGFEFAGWTSTLAKIKSEKFFLGVGPCYKKSGTPVSILVVDVNDVYTTVTVSVSVRGGGRSYGAYIDWGDGTSPTFAAGSSAGSVPSKTHSYETVGRKYISIYKHVGDSSSYAFIALGGGTNSYIYPIVAQTSSYTSYSRSSVLNYGPIDSLLVSIIENPDATWDWAYIVGHGRLRFSNFGGLAFANCPLAKIGSWEKPDNTNQSSLWGPFNCASVNRIPTFGGNTTASTFLGCDSLKDVVFRADAYLPKRLNVGRTLVFKKTKVPFKKSSIAEYEYGTGLIYVPDEAVGLYKADEVFAPVADCIRPISEYPDF